MGTSRTLVDAKSAGARTKRRRAGPYQQVPRLLLFLGRLQLGARSLIPVPELEPPGSISPPWEIIPWGAPNWVALHHAPPVEFHTVPTAKVVGMGEVVVGELTSARHAAPSTQHGPNGTVLGI